MCLFDGLVGLGLEGYRLDECLFDGLWVLVWRGRGWMSVY